MNRKFIVSLALLALILCVPSSALASKGPFKQQSWDIVSVLPSSVAVNQRIFREGDSVTVAINDEYPNLCYRPAPVNADVDLNLNQIILTDRAFLKKGGFCALIAKPESRTIDLGRLPTGTYELALQHEDGSQVTVDQFSVEAQSTSEMASVGGGI